MKNLILAIFLLVATTTIAQNNLFNNISTTAQYDEYWSVYDQDGDGLYAIDDKRFVCKFELKYLATGEGYSIEAVVNEGKNVGHVVKRMNVVELHDVTKGYPYESVSRHKYQKNGFVAVGDYVFFLNNISADGTSFGGIDNVFIKRSSSSSQESASSEKAPKKKRASLKDLRAALKNGYGGGSSGGSKAAPNHGADHQKLQKQNIKKMITDYLVTMKAKQDARTASEKQHETNIINAKGKNAEELKAYNDKIKASPEYAKLKAHQAAMEKMDNASSNGSVTVYNKTGKDIYIYENGSRNGTRINVNSSAKVDCSSSYTYKFDANSAGLGDSCYISNSDCNGSVSIR